jgi:hypothetical protein
MKACLPFLLCLVTVSLCAEGVYVCIQPNGSREYRNTGDTRGCKKLELDGISMIPSAPGQSGGGSKEKSTLPTDPSFPRIENQIQKRRDQDRLQILLEEVKSEETKLANLKKEYQNGEPERLGSERNYAKYLERVALLKDEVQRTEKNIEALKREISNLK